MGYSDDVREASRAILLGYLDRAGWNIAKAARAAGVYRQDMYSLMRRLSIALPAGRCKQGNEAWRALQ